MQTTSPMHHFKYAEENFAEDKFKWSKHNVTIKFKNRANNLSQWCQNCLVHVRMDILEKRNSLEKKPNFTIKFESSEKKIFLKGKSKLHTISPEKVLRKTNCLEKKFLQLNSHLDWRNFGFLTNIFGAVPKLLRTHPEELFEETFKKSI